MIYNIIKVAENAVHGDCIEQPFNLVARQFIFINILQPFDEHFEPMKKTSHLSSTIFDLYNNLF